ncbi:MAG: hypothetical protein WCQ95_12985 [Bacteroidota bacterium]
MKKLFITGLFLITFGLPIIAQVDHDYNANDVIPVTQQTLNKDQIPMALLQAVNTDFDLSNPKTWTKFPYALKEYGWVYDKGASDVKPDRYQVTMKTNNGDDMYAVYSKDGILIATREVNNNATVPAIVLAELAKSIYSDWKIVGSKEIIRYYYDKNSVEQHFRLTVQKDNVTRTLSFNYQNSAADVAKTK